MQKPQQNRENLSRLYLALWPDQETQNRLQSMRHTWSWPKNAAVVKPESLHLTLHFLGDVENRRIPELVQGLNVTMQPFDLIMNRPQLWPNGVAVLKPHSIPTGLSQLHAGLDAALRGMGIITEARTYRPHVTFARNAEQAIPPTMKQVQPVLWTVKSYALVKSHNGYTIVQHYE